MKAPPTATAPTLAAVDIYCFISINQFDFQYQ
jgi:hypothetical protein